MLFDTNPTLLEENSLKLLIRNSVAEKPKKNTCELSGCPKCKAWGKLRYNFFFLLPLSACFPSPGLSNQTQNTGLQWTKEIKPERRAEAQETDQEPVGFRVAPLQCSSKQQRGRIPHSSLTVIKELSSTFKVLNTSWVTCSKSILEQGKVNYTTYYLSVFMMDG